jgi:hypothetical protein
MFGDRFVELGNDCLEFTGAQLLGVRLKRLDLAGNLRVRLFCHVHLG